MTDTFLLLISIILIIIGILLTQMPVDECPECAHCRYRKEQERIEAQAREEHFGWLAHQRYHEATGLKETECRRCINERRSSQ